MMSLVAPFRFVAVIAAAALSASCRRGAPPAIDPVLASCLPADCTVAAGVDCDRVRASPLYAKLPAAATALLTPYRGASRILAASTGKDYLIVARGRFSSAPPGATLLAPGLAAAGSPEWLRAAEAQHRKGARGFPALLRMAEPVAKTAEIWIAAMGNASLPLSGNAENITRLLHSTQYATLGARLGDAIQLEVDGVCATPATAQHLEESLRAMITLGEAVSSRQPPVVRMLQSIDLRHEDRTMRGILSVPPGDAGALFQLF